MYETRGLSDRPLDPFGQNNCSDLVKELDV